MLKDELNITKLEKGARVVYNKLKKHSSRLTQMSESNAINSFIAKDFDDKIKKETAKREELEKRRMERFEEEARSKINDWKDNGL